MKNKSWNKWNMTAAIIGAAIGWACLGMSNVCRAQSMPADLSPDVQEVLTLSKQHMDDSVITNYIYSTGKAYKLSADDIIYLNGQGVSQPVISALLQTSSGPGASTPASAGAPATPPPTTDAAPATPPPLDQNSPAPTDTTPPPAMEEAPPSEPPQAMPGSLVDNFYTEGGLNGALWQVQTPLLASLAAMNGAMVSPLLSFSPSGMQMSGTGGPGQFMGIQSSMAFNAPLTFSASVIGMAQDATPFDVYFVSPDLQQYLSIDAHLGGRGVRPRGAVAFWGPFGGVRVPTGSGNAPDYGIWINHTGSGQPIHALGSKIFDHPIAGVPYTLQVSVGPDGVAQVTVLDANHGVLGSHHVPVGTGPFYLVLAGRDGPTYAVWQSVTMTSTGPPVAMAMAAPAPAPDVAVPPTPTMDYFQGQLAPYGNWVNVPGYGMAWQPAVSPGWRPYYDGGHWEYTDAGYFWQSDYPWGDITFHYGRWAYTAAGWIWVPGYDYAPSWVVWRHDDADGYVGWAPLPPGAVFVDGGWMWHGGRVAADFDFGMGVGFFSFVGYDHFWEHNYRPFIVPHDRLVFAFGHSAIVNHYSFNHGVFVNVGLPHDRMVVYTHRDFHPVAIGEVRHEEEVHHAVMRENDVHSFHPGAAPNAWGHGPVGHPQGNPGQGNPGGGHQPQGNQGGGHQQGGNQGGGHQDNGHGGH